MSHALLVSIGSSGDLNPFIGLGRALLQRGHRATLVANRHFERLARFEGLGFAEMGTAEQYEKAVNHPDGWDQHQGSQALAPFALQSMREGFRSIERFCGEPDTILVGSRFAFAALLAKERFQLPTITLLLNLPTLRSIYSPPALASVPDLSLRGPEAAKLIFKNLDKRYDGVFLASLNEYRSELSLPPIASLADWWYSADLLIAAWPDWLYPPQQDWPPHAVCTGFIEYDGAATVEPSPHATSNQANPYEAYIVFTPGTGVTHAHDFFRAATEACIALGRRGIFLTQRREQIPAHLPSCIQHVHYAPLADLLSRASAVVHAGGIGTAARALRCGVPQLIMPMSHDQFENAARLSRLGVAASLLRDQLAAGLMTQLLKELLGSPAVAERCRHWAREMSQETSLSRICELIESVCKGESGTECAIALSQ